jgi:hypothetical protein
MRNISFANLSNGLDGSSGDSNRRRNSLLRMDSYNLLEVSLEGSLNSIEPNVNNYNGMTGVQLRAQLSKNRKNLAILAHNETLLKTKGDLMHLKTVRFQMEACQQEIQLIEGLLRSEKNQVLQRKESNIIYRSPV